MRSSTGSCTAPDCSADYWRTRSMTRSMSVSTVASRTSTRRRTSGELSPGEEIKKTALIIRLSLRARPNRHAIPLRRGEQKKFFLTAKLTQTGKRESRKSINRKNCLRAQLRLAEIRERRKILLPSVAASSIDSLINSTKKTRAIESSRASEFASRFRGIKIEFMTRKTQHDRKTVPLRSSTIVEWKAKTKNFGLSVYARAKTFE